MTSTETITSAIETPYNWVANDFHGFDTVAYDGSVIRVTDDDGTIGIYHLSSNGICLESADLRCSDEVAIAMVQAMLNTTRLSNAWSK